MMRTLAQAEAVARAAIDRRHRQERAQRTADHAASVTRRLEAATAVVEARRRRQAAVQTVLHTPQTVPMRSWKRWFAEALRDTPDDDRDYVWSPPW